MAHATQDPAGRGDLAHLDHVLGLFDRFGELVAHDMSDPREAAFMESLARRGGMTPERYPALFEGIRHRPEQAPLESRTVLFAEAENDGSFGPDQIVDFLGALAANGNTKAQATFTRNKPIDTVTVWVSAVNQDSLGNTTVLASGQDTKFNQQTVLLATDDATALPLPNTGSNWGVVSYYVLYKDGTEERSSKGTQWALNAAANPVVTAPVQYPGRQTGNLNAIVIGLSRGYNSPSNNSDIDYWFWQNQWQNTTLLMPLQGSMKFLYPIAPLNANNPKLEFYLARKEGGMSELKATNVQQYLKYFSIDPSDSTKLNFSLMATGTTAGGAINFGLSPWVADTSTYFTCRITVNFNNPQFGQGWSSILSTTTNNPKPVLGLTYIKPVVYVWHCMVEGTLITMADGSTKPVETLDSGDVVRSGGTTRKVLATLAQPHWGTVYTIHLHGGQNLTCSGTHPVMTPGGAVQASTLQAGQQVLTDGGTGTVANITTYEQQGQGLFNLWLDPTSAGQTIMVANGIVVGDYQIQVALIEASERQPELVRARLPERLHRDFDSWLEDRVAATY